MKPNLSPAARDEERRRIKAEDTICVSDDLRHASITNRIGQKYAHKLLQDYIKRRTGLKGYWTFWHEYTDNDNHVYTIDNPIVGLATQSHL